uniref:Uncharacterized protein n=1 Tax=Rhizophora mucronata TaxID=61149 RepID=A0A2P2IVM5_RHIMU
MLISYNEELFEIPIRLVEPSIKHKISTSAPN